MRHPSERLQLSSRLAKWPAVKAGPDKHTMPAFGERVVGESSHFGLTAADSFGRH